MATSAFGYNYTANDPNWNPWATYGGGTPAPGYNDSYYNRAQDNAIWQNNGQAERSIDRVWRWTLDDMKARGLDPGSVDRGTLQSMWLNNVARLRRDIEAPDNASRGLTWAGSGLAGYDKFLGAHTPSTDIGGTIGKPPPPTPTPALPPRPNPAPPPPPNPGLGGAPGGGGSAGLSGAGAAGLADDPELAYQYMLRQLGIDPSIPGYFSSFLKQKFAPLLQARLAASALGEGGAPGIDNGRYLDQFGNTVQDFGRSLFQQGGNFYQGQADIAQRALQGAQPYLSGLENQDQVKGYLDQLQTLAYAGANPLVQQSLADTIDRGYQQYKYNSFQQMNAGQGAGDPYLEWLRNNAKYNRYLPVR